VLILDATDTNSPWGLAFRSTIRSEISGGSKTPVAIYSEVLELGRFNSPRYQEVLRTFLREKYRDRPIGAIVVHGSLALQIFLRMRDELWPGVPVVFAFLDRQTLAQLSLPPDITGTTFQLTLRNVVAAARALVPNLKRIALVGTRFDRDPFRSHFTQELASLAGEIEFIDLMDLPLGEVQKRVASLSDDTVVYYSNIYPVGQQTTLMLADVVPFLARESNRPVLTDNEKFIGLGSVGGIVGVPELMAIESAKRALRLLDGEPASQMPIAAVDFSRPIFDWRQLQRFNISEARLPPGSDIRFRSPTAWDLYRWQILLIVAVVLMQGLMISGLLIEHRRRRLAEVESRRRLLEVMHLNRVATAGEMSASIAHEINQPLAAIVSSANASLRWLANSAPNLEGISAALKRIVSDGHRASQVIESVRTLVKKDAQEKTLNNLNDIVGEVLALLRSELTDHQVAVKSVLTEDYARVLADRTQLQQVILNLVKNAIEAMTTVTDRARILRIGSGAKENGEVFITIEDSGSGIDPKVMDRIFEPFFTTKSHGMGMGLSICRTIVEAHDGRLTAVTAHPHGSVFQVILPISRHA
jgi:signal transduction histidine kinase